MELKYGLLFAVLGRSCSSCYCLQWTELLLWWISSRQIKQRCRRKTDRHWHGSCPQDCPGGGTLLLTIYHTMEISHFSLVTCSLSTFHTLFIARRPAQRIHLQRLFLSQRSVEKRQFHRIFRILQNQRLPVEQILLWPLAYFLYLFRECLSVVIIRRENPYFHPQQVRVPVCEKAGQDDPVPGGGQDPQQCSLRPVCQPPRQRGNDWDCAWRKAKHSLLDLCGEDGRT